MPMHVEMSVSLWVSIDIGSMYVYQWMFVYSCIKRVAEEVGEDGKF